MKGEPALAGEQAAIAEALRENWFWAGVFRDHATFIFERLAPGQEKEIRWARGFAESFERIHEESLQVARSASIPGPAGTYAVADPPPEAPLAALGGHELRIMDQKVQRLARASLEVLGSLRTFKQELLERHLECRVRLGLGPTLLAHMIVEAEEGHRALTGAREKADLPPALESLHHHLIWLPDAAGHAAALNNGLDGPEQELRERTERFHQLFSGMQIRALELYSMLRVAPRMVGALSRLNRDAVAQIGVFRAFLAELRQHLEGCEVLGTLTPLLADHMLREELYYTEKLMRLDRRAPAQ